MSQILSICPQATHPILNNICEQINPIRQYKHVEVKCVEQKRKFWKKIYDIGRAHKRKKRKIASECQGITDKI